MSVMASIFGWLEKSGKRVGLAATGAIDQNRSARGAHRRKKSEKIPSQTGKANTFQKGKKV
ncbi:MAG: hypothetical protein RI556_08975 [Hydrogenovibrio sp.]|uniref:hypothetical protein n=1 Tax=Hydrogenovibrio TaxID=28884 RepID=UPI0012FE61A1|nr:MULTISPECIES: hypothetical protein [Hydrogenovibrio]MDR9499293.1 hypothetical protein [Hydrogenovibrio sp.]